MTHWCCLKISVRRLLNFLLLLFIGDFFFVIRYLIVSTSSDTLVLLEDKCASPLKLLLTARVTCRLLPCRDIHDRDGDDCDEEVMIMLVMMVMMMIVVMVMMMIMIAGTSMIHDDPVPHLQDHQRYA